MKNLFLFLAASFLLACDRPAGDPGAAPAGAVAPPPASSSGPAALAAEGDKIALPDGGWFTWKFSEKPKLGTIVVKVQAFNKDGARDTSLEFTGESGMPSMRDHDSGPVKFQLNRKGDYLLPVNIVMAGEWQVLVRAARDKKEVYAGKTLFNI